GADGLVEQAPGDALPNEVELEGANLIGTQLIGGATEVAGEASDAGEVSFDGLWSVVAEAEVIGHALAQGGHGRICRQAGGGRVTKRTPAEGCARGRRCASR